jgi:hypothetical protein
MSLKAFHIVFVTVCTLFCLGFGLWGLREHRLTQDTAMLVQGVGALAAAVALIAYGRWFLRKLKHVSYL